MVIGALKSSDIILGIQIEVHVHMSPKLSPLAVLEALGKEEVKAKAGLTPACWSIEGRASDPIQRRSLAKVETYWFKVFKEISV